MRFLGHKWASRRCRYCGRRKLSRFHWLMRFKLWLHELKEKVFGYETAKA